MDIYVLLYNFGTEKEGIHSIELKGRTIVLMFEEKDDAEPVSYTHLTLPTSVPV